VSCRLEAAEDGTDCRSSDAVGREVVEKSHLSWIIPWNFENIFLVAVEFRQLPGIPEFTIGASIALSERN